MTEHKLLDAAADVLPVGLQPTPFGEVWQALQQVAASVWDVDPSVYRAGIAWMWYALRNPAALDADGLRPLLVAALISEQAPLVKDTQTVAELAEYLRLWRDYMPTYPKLEALYSVFAAEVEILPITAPGYAPPANTRLAFFVVIRGIDFDRPLTADEAALIAVRATPMGSHPVVVTELSEGFSLPVYPLRAGVPGISVENDALCEPVTPPTPSYQEITLYMVNENKHTQLNVTSGFTGDVSSSYCYQLYTDEACTIPWTGYDYSNEYVVGKYNEGGEWEPDAIQSVADMPDTATSSGFKNAFILMDTGAVWFASSSSVDYGYYLAKSSITLRIYPKDQQYYSLYGGASRSAYNNVTISNGDHRSLYGTPNRGSSSLIVPWGESDASLPTRTLQAVLGSAGNSVSGLSLYTGSNSFNIQNSSGASREFRAVVFTLSKPTIISYTNTTNTVVTVNSSTPATLYDNSGNTIPYDANHSYIILGAFGVSGRFYGTFGAAVTDSWAIIQNLKLTANGSGNLQVEFVGSQALSINKVWYTKTPKPIEVNFGDPVTIPAGYHIESVKCQRLYVKASAVTHSVLSQSVSFVFDGENQYCGLNDTALLGAGVTPCLTMFAIAGDQGGGYWITYRPMSSTVNPVVSLSNKQLNSGGSFVSADALVSGATSNADTIANALNAYPALFRYYDSTNTIVPYYFKIQRSLWQFQNGVFSWLGDTADVSDLAYWYNGRAVQITLAKDE